MRNIMRNIIYNQCPNCKKRGVRAVGKIGRSGYTVTCKYCQRKYRANSVLAVLINLFVAIIVGVGGSLFNKFVFSPPLIAWLVLAILLHYLLEYFAPLETQEDNKNKKQ